ncbi:unnamed protein product [Cylindrotheca closterium]|uniref:VWFD domain-containing protein n=1 Tax=Cylindrotheca closterium TaxID=2856 RepID=A0AAD2CI62_9STRA|nr:unnamed protein product [Cylindrotheca closterium]
MKISCSIITLVTLLLGSLASFAKGQVAPLYEAFDLGFCRVDPGDLGIAHDLAYVLGWDPNTAVECDQLCRDNDPFQGLRGFSEGGTSNACSCWYDNGLSPGEGGNCPSVFTGCNTAQIGTGEIEATVDWGFGRTCFKYNRFPVGSEANGDPHFRTWKNEHFEFHGQCDIVMTKVKNFANKDIDLDIHLRTSMVRYWSYIKAASIRIGNDILEVQGSSAAKEDGEDKRHHWINFEYRGDIADLGGFPVTISPRNDKYIIDLDSAYPGQMIEIKTYKEFVGVKIIGATEESFGNAVGITGDFNTGNTYARDGNTVLNDFNELGMEWQVLPSDGKLFHEMARPQFPELCYLPEDPRGERGRRLDESNITKEEAEAACAGLDDEFDRKGCIYDILATQDLDMVGAY